MLKKYIDQISKSEKQQLGIDFDGVIHKNSKGFNDGTIYDEPIEGAIDSIEYLNKQLGFDLVIYSCKARPDRPLINGKTGIDLIWEWLNKHNLKNYIKERKAVNEEVICKIFNQIVDAIRYCHKPVSYTHLTLPTICSV